MAQQAPEPAPSAAAAAWPAPLPLFPLRLVLFPGARLGLKVFEARYLDLVADCLRARQPFGVVCLRAGNDTARKEVALEDTGVLAHIDEVEKPELRLPE